MIDLYHIINIYNTYINQQSIKFYVKKWDFLDMEGDWMIVGNYFLRRMAIKHAHSRMLTLGYMCMSNSPIYTRTHSLLFIVVGKPR